MQPQLCSRCKKNIAVVFITRQENGQNVNEGLCLKCAKNLGLPQVDEMMRRMGITDEDLDNISNEMMGAFGGAENLEGLTDATIRTPTTRTRTARPLIPVPEPLFGGIPLRTTHKMATRPSRRRARAATRRSKRGASTNSSTPTASISPSAHATASSTRSSAARRPNACRHFIPICRTIRQPTLRKSSWPQAG